MKKMKFLVTLLGLFVLVYASAQEVVREEFINVQTDNVLFENFQGVVINPNTVAEIRGIGRALANMAQMDGQIYRLGDKYAIRESGNEELDGLLSAAIIYVNPDALVENVRNLRLIISGYLEVRYGYSMEDADTLAYFLTFYNAIHRGDVAFFASRYKPEVMIDVDQSNAGLATSYTQWPGRTRIFIPLSFGNDPFLNEIDRDVIDATTQDGDVSLNMRDSLLDIKEDSLTSDRVDIDNLNNEIQQNEENLAVLEDALQQAKDDLAELQNQDNNTEILRGNLHIIVRIVEPDGTVIEDVYDNISEVITQHLPMETSKEFMDKEKMYLITMDEKNEVIDSDKEIDAFTIEEYTDSNGNTTNRVIIVIRDLPEGSQSQGSESAVQPEGNQVQGSESAIQPEGSQSQGSESATQPGGSQVQGSESAAQPEGNQVQGSESATQPEGSQSQGSESATQPEGSQVQGSESVAQPEGNQVQGSEAGKANDSEVQAKLKEIAALEQEIAALEKENQRLKDLLAQREADLKEKQRQIEEERAQLEQDRAVTDKGAESGDQSAADKGAESGDQSAADKGAESGDQSAADKGAESGDQSAVDKGAESGDQGTADKGAESGDQGTADKGAESGDQGTADKGAESGDQSAVDKGAESGDQSAVDKGAESGDQGTADKGAESGDQGTADKGAESGDQTVSDKDQGVQSSERDAAKENETLKDKINNDNKVNPAAGKSGSIYFMLDTGVRQGGRHRNAIVSFDLETQQITSRSPDNIASRSFALTRDGLIAITEHGSGNKPQFYLTILDKNTLQPIKISNIPLHGESFIYIDGGDIYAMSESEGDKSVLLRFNANLDITVRSEAIVSPGTTLTQHQDYVFVEHSSGSYILVLNRKDLTVIAEIKI
ncbi:P83/100 family protein [Entomospira nematocerorum]|uniref:Uncharacterized protein n=1 Tax=Entomospira nematocerorum TaxID=2719987 RepID=A0A968KTA0_9SPIO|nr:P83/100 family protein [Entomospira nematocera]NIZ47206.1 hypothetical protein [Entomospira nematocera]WDI34251.1 P83/100 family protein [Entomospira nematocera]